MPGQKIRLICDRAGTLVPSWAGDFHDITGHHRYYGSSATGGGERLVETRHPRQRHLNVCGF
jgi:hypothetical protein